MLEGMQSLSKMISRKDTFVYDFVASIKLNVKDLYNMYVHFIERYDDPQFQISNNLVDHICDVLHMVSLQHILRFATFICD
jgi:hypothetical protein